MKQRVSIIGASGYSGAELLSLLSRHPYAEVTSVFANSSTGKRVEELYPAFRGTAAGSLVYGEFSSAAVAKDDIVFIALPSGEAMKHVPALIDAGKRVIDLGGDFRLKDSSLYTKYYKHDHTAASYLPKAVYGLPEWNADAIRSAQLIANPGCYVTSALLPLLPLLKEGLVEPNGIVISSMSGVSGAGRSASTELSFTEVNESVKAYKATVHQHTPEIETVLTDFGGRTATVTFVPHLIPVTRGIFSTMYLRPAAPLTADDIRAVLTRQYASAPFVRLIGEASPEIKHVQHTNFIDIGWKPDPRNGTLVLFSVIDNLVKGAAGQAVQNMNLLIGANETEGLR